MVSGICFDCLKEVPILHHHHLDGKHGAIQPDNIILCCPRCHRKRHEGIKLSSDYFLPPEERKQYYKCLKLLKDICDGKEKILESEYNSKLAQLKDEHTLNINNLINKYKITSEYRPLYTYPFPLHTLELFNSILLGDK